MTLTLTAAVPERGVDAALSLPDGEHLALLGPNGAGKSTLLSVLSGLLRPRDGRTALDGRVLADVVDGRTTTWVPPHARRIATLTQDPMLFPHLTAVGNIMFGLRAHGVPRRDARDRAHAWLEEIGLPQLADRRPAQLSGGQAQRIAIARALATEPSLLLLDEPMAALDIDVRPSLRDLLARFLEGRTTILVTHDLLDAVTLADRVAVIEDGRVVEQGRTTDVLARPRSAFAARFAGVNLLHGAARDGGVVLPGGERFDAAGGAEAVPGTALCAAFRPSAVALLEPDAPDDGRAVLRRTVTRLEQRGDDVRVRAEDVFTDLPPQGAAARSLRIGDPVRLAVSTDEIDVYPA